MYCHSGRLKLTGWPELPVTNPEHISHTWSFKIVKGKQAMSWADHST